MKYLAFNKNSTIYGCLQYTFRTHNTHSHVGFLYLLLSVNYICISYRRWKSKFVEYNIHTTGDLRNFMVYYRNLATLQYISCNFLKYSVYQLDFHRFIYFNIYVYP